MSTRRTVFAGPVPPPGRQFDWVTEPSARALLSEGAEIADVALVKELLDEAVPVIDSLTSTTPFSLLRDEFFALVLATARVEATRRSLDSEADWQIVGSRHLPRPSRPSRIAQGLAESVGAPIEWVGLPRPRRSPAGMYGRVRAFRWSRGQRSAPTRVVAAVGGPSERRALEPVLRHLEPGSATMVDFGLEPDESLPSFGAHLGLRDAVRPLRHRDFQRLAADIWGSHDWWGAKWRSWVEPSLSVMGRITLREAVLFREAARRALTGASTLITAKVRFARARAIVSAATELGLKTIGTQHGVYVDGNEWTALEVGAFGVAGDAFRRVLQRRGFEGEIFSVGAPYYRSPDHEWDCGIALQPPEGVVITSPADYARHVRVAYDAATSVLGAEARIGFRLHPREDAALLRSIVGPTPPVSRDPDRGGRIWITIESSFVPQAVLTGAPTILMNLNDHPWEYPFAGMEGIRVARSAAELRSQLGQVEEGEMAGAVAAWKKEFAVATGDEAARLVARLIEDRSTP